MNTAEHVRAALTQGALVRHFGRGGRKALACNIGTASAFDGEVPRGRVSEVRDPDVLALLRSLGEGWRGCWRITDPDHYTCDLLVIGDYLSAEGALLNWTSGWADEQLL